MICNWLIFLNYCGLDKVVLKDLAGCGVQCQKWADVSCMCEIFPRPHLRMGVLKWKQQGAGNGALRNSSGKEKIGTGSVRPVIDLCVWQLRLTVQHLEKQCNLYDQRVHQYLNYLRNDSNLLALMFFIYLSSCIIFYKVTVFQNSSSWVLSGWAVSWVSDVCLCFSPEQPHLSLVPSSVYSLTQLWSTHPLR